MCSEVWSELGPARQAGRRRGRPRMQARGGDREHVSWGKPSWFTWCASFGGWSRPRRFRIQVFADTSLGTRRPAMDLDLLLLHVFCLVDDALCRLGLNHPRQRGPEPTLDDAEVITMEIVGEFLELHDDTKVFWFFRRYHSRDFPTLQSVPRPTFVRQAANLWEVKRQLQRYLAHQLVPDDVSWLVDSLPIRACRFGRAHFCRRFRGQAAYGYDHGDRTRFYGFRLHVRCDRLSGVVLAYQLAPANAADKAVLHEL